MTPDKPRELQQWRAWWRETEGWTRNEGILQAHAAIQATIAALKAEKLRADEAQTDREYWYQQTTTAREGRLVEKGRADKAEAALAKMSDDRPSFYHATMSLTQQLATAEKLADSLGGQRDTYYRERNEAIDRLATAEARIARYQDELVDKHNALLDAEAAVERLIAAINWASGCAGSNFGDDIPEDAPPYWWRKVLTDKAVLVYNRLTGLYERGTP